MPLSRRDVIRAALATGSLVAIKPIGVLAQPLGTTAGAGASRRSKLFPGTFLVHSDLHNHTMFSDGVADPEEGFADMRLAGLDVAAFTDHAVFGEQVATACAHTEGLSSAQQEDCSAIAGINTDKWRRTAELADAANVDGEFTAVRGFEWSSSNLGHLNVWFSDGWVDPAQQGALGDHTSLLEAIQDDGGLPPALGTPLTQLGGSLPATTTIDGFYEWLRRDPAATDFTGQPALFGFNHPNELGNYERYKFAPDMVDRAVSVEMHNLEQDYFFQSTSHGDPFPLNALLNAGWRPGILGVSDEHGPTLGSLGESGIRGRGGLWVDTLSRESVRDALADRRMFSTDIQGLRLDASAQSLTAGGSAVRMGRAVRHAAGELRIGIDLCGGPAMIGRPLLLQVLTRAPAGEAPTILRSMPITMQGDADDAFFTDVVVDPAQTDWIVLRFCDPALPPDPEATGDYAAAGRAVAYASPFYLEPAADGLRALVRRIAGDGAAATSAEVSAAVFPDRAGGAVVAGAAAFPDALSGGPLAALAGPAPLLQTDHADLDDVVRAELDRLQPAAISLLGGTSAVSDRVEAQLSAIAPVTRLGGANRFATAELVGQQVFPDGADDVWVCNGEQFADAMAGGAAAAAADAPLLLVTTDRLPQETTRELERLSPRRIVLLGGTTAVDADVEAALGAIAPVERIEGLNRFDTAARISRRTFDAATEVFVVGEGATAASLAATPAAFARGAPVLLVRTDDIPPETDAELRRLGPRQITIVGGAEGVSQAVQDQLADYESR